METVNEMIKGIKENLTQTSRSSKDEIRIMKGMLSDPTYEVNVYDSNGSVETYCPAKEFRSLCASVMANTAKIPLAEASAMMDGYEVRRSEASAMVGLSKEFINTYMQTGRKLPLGGREDSDISLSGTHIPETTRLYPQRVGVNDDGSPRYTKTPTVIPAHGSIRIQSPCPPWVSDKKK